MIDEPTVFAVQSTSTPVLCSISDDGIWITPDISRDDAIRCLTHALEAYRPVVADNGRLLGEVARLTEQLRAAQAALAEIARHAEQPAARTLAASTLNALAAAE